MELNHTAIISYTVLSIVHGFVRAAVSISHCMQSTCLSSATSKARIVLFGTGDSATLPLDPSVRRCATIGLRILKTAFWAVCRLLKTLATTLNVLVRHVTLMCGK